MLKILLIGEHDSTYPPHVATTDALHHSAKRLQVEIDYHWLSTQDITAESTAEVDGVWIAPGSPYRNMGKTLQLIQHARTNGLPCLGTCGGFQHMVIEFARNELGIKDADHAEYDPYASCLLVSKLDCSLAGRELPLTFTNGSRVADIYGHLTATETYYCDFGVNPAFARELSDGGFRIVGSDSEGEARVMEIADHPFYLGTLFVPQMRSTSQSPHPIVTAFIRAVGEAGSQRQHG